MVDQTGTDRPQFNEHADDMLEEAVATAEKRRASTAEEVKPKDPPHQLIRRRTDGLRMALKAAKNQDSVKLPELSRTNPMGEEIRLRVRRLTVQELAASNSLPTRADKLVSVLIDKSMASTKGERARVGMQDEISTEEVESLIEDTYGGMTREAIAAFFEFQCAVCCAAVIDDDYRLYMTQEEVNGDPERGVLVWDIPDLDREVIYNWVMSQEDVAANTVMPFRDTADTRIHVRPEPVGEETAERPDSV